MAPSWQAEAQAPLFGGIKDEELEKLLVCMDSTRKKYRRQEMILSEEEIPDRIGIVLEGSVQVVQDDVFGNRNIVEKLEKGGLFGAAFACAGVRKSPVSVIAERAWRSVKRLPACPAGVPGRSCCPTCQRPQKKKRSGIL